MRLFESILRDKSPPGSWMSAQGFRPRSSDQWVGIRTQRLNWNLQCLRHRCPERLRPGRVRREPRLRVNRKADSTFYVFSKDDRDRPIAVVPVRQADQLPRNADNDV